MRCPIDKKDMIVVEHQKIELDYCLQCNGVWFDAQELELLVESFRKQGAQIANTGLLTPQAANVKESPRQCPICAKKMDKVWLGKEPRVLIDSCPQGHGLWFDGGELHQVLCQLAPSDKKGSPDIISFLGDTFKADCKK
jgi:uncharacterized protein